MGTPDSEKVTVDHDSADNSEVLETKYAGTERIYAFSSIANFNRPWALDCRKSVLEGHDLLHDLELGGSQRRRKLLPVE